MQQPEGPAPDCIANAIARFPDYLFDLTLNAHLTVFGPFHIHRFGKALCHADGGAFIEFEDAAGMNHHNCCDDCKRRYANLAKMMKIESTLFKQVDKRLLREITEKNSLIS